MQTPPHPTQPYLRACLCSAGCVLSVCSTSAAFFSLLFFTLIRPSHMALCGQAVWVCTHAHARAHRPTIATMATNPPPPSCQMQPSIQSPRGSAPNPPTPNPPTQPSLSAGSLERTCRSPPGAQQRSESPLTPTGYHSVHTLPTLHTHQLI